MKPPLAHQYPEFLSCLVASDGALVSQYEADWLPECALNIDEQNHLVTWQPTLREPAGDFSAIENALGMELHEDIKYLFGAWWSGHILAETDRGTFDVLHAWNTDDFDCLLQNIVGHLVMKRQLKQQPTIFFATTDEDDYILSVINETGQVVLERVGCEPQEVIAESLSELFKVARVRQAMFQDG